MNSKCTKYESLFIFGNDEDLQSHIKSCPDCQREHAEMEKVSCLAKEVKPFIRKKTFNKKIYSQIAACAIISMLAFISMKSIYYQDNNPDLKVVKANSVVTKMGLPTDEYGLLNIE